VVHNSAVDVCRKSQDKSPTPPTRAKNHNPCTIVVCVSTLLISSRRYQLKHPTHRAPTRRARAKYTFYILYTAPCGTPQTTPADLEISIHLLLGFMRRVPMRLHACTEPAKHKGCGICVWYSEPLPDESTPANMGCFHQEA
jgi:hypothetical protein